MNVMKALFVSVSLMLGAFAIHTSGNLIDRATVIMTEATEGRHG